MHYKKDTSFTWRISETNENARRRKMESKLSEGTSLLTPGKEAKSKYDQYHSIKTEPSQIKDGQVQDSGYAWVILGACSFLRFLRGFRGGILSIYLVYFNEYFGLSWSETTIISAIQSLMAEVMSLPFSFFVRRFGSRVAAISGTGVVVIALIISCFAENVIMIYVFFGGLAGIGFVSYNIPSTVPVQMYFSNRLGIASGINFSAIGFGLFISPIVIVLLTDTFGWRGSLLIIAGLYLNAIVAGLLIRPYRVTVLEDAISNNKQQTPEKANKTKFGVFSKLHKHYYIFLAIWGFLQMGHSSMVLFTFTRATKLGFTEDKATSLSSIMGLISMGRFMFGFIGDLKFINRMLFLGIATFLGGVSITVSTFSDNFVHLLVFQILFGLCSAAYITMYPCVMVDIVGKDNLEVASGAFLVVMGLGSFMASVMTGPLIDATGDVNIPFLIYGAFMICSGVSFIILTIFRMCLHKKTPRSTHNGIVYHQLEEDND